MKRIATANREIDKFGPGKDGFRVAVPGVSDPTYLSAQFLNAIQESIVRVIERSGLAPTEDYDQFFAAIIALSETVNTRDSGAIRNGIADDAAAVALANTTAGKRPLRFVGIHRIATPITITAPIVDTMEQIFTVDSHVTIANGGTIRPEWWGAKCVGTTDSTLPIRAMFASINQGYGSKGGARFLFASPQNGNQFYKLTDTIDLFEVWNSSIECESRPYADRDVAGSGLFRWYGAVDKVGFMMGFNLALDTKNLTFDGRDTAGVVAFAFGTTGGGFPITVCDASTHTNMRAHRCDVGIRVGDSAGGGGDFSALVFINPSVYYNKSQGFCVNSGNAIVTCTGLDAHENGFAPTGGKRGCNTFLGSGQLTLNGYISIGAGAEKPTDADIWQENGGLQVYGAWSDTHGYFLYSNFATSIAHASTLNGVRHFEGSMSAANTPTSIRWVGPNPLVLNGCHLYGDVELTSGVQGKIVDMGTRFIRAGATFTGTGTAAGGYIGIGTQNGKQEAAITVGKPQRSDVGGNCPMTLWSGNYTTGNVRTTGATTITETIMDGVGFEILYNAYNALGTYRSIGIGATARILFDPVKGFSVSKGTVAAAAGQVVVFVVAGVPVYANNEAAITSGLSPGSFYRTGANPDPLCIVH